MNYHLLVVCHGLWGTTEHVKYLVDSAKINVKPALDKDNREIKLVVLSAQSHTWTKTYDGIDINAQRVVSEIDEQIKTIREDGGNVTRFSIVGYSLGGLTARYVLGLLDSRTPSFFDDIKPVNFATFASPWIGIPAYASAWSSIIRYLGARMLSRTGAQLYGADRFLPESFITKQSSKMPPKSLLSRFKKEPAEPLLSVLADPRYSFFKALSAFERVEVFANSVNDRTVPYPTGAIEAHDPFALARAKAREIMDARQEDPNSPVDYAEGGLEIVLDSRHGPLIESYTLLTEMELPKRDGTAPIMKKRRFVLPLLLRPTTYPFSRPVSLAIIAFLPLALPLSLVYLVGQFLLHGRQSQQRIKVFRKELGEEGREGWLERVNITLQQAADEVVGVHHGEGASSDNLSATSSAPLNVAYDGHNANNVAYDGHDAKDESASLKHPVFSAFASYSEGTETPPLARPLSPGRLVDSEAVGSKEKPYPTDPVLTERQITMIRHINSIPQLRKHLTFLPTARNSHGIIVSRDTARFAGHAEGKAFVDFWAKDFVL